MASLKPRTANAASPLRARIGEQVASRLDANPRMKRVPVDGVQIYHHRDFLDEAQCAALIRMIDGQRRPSTTLAPSGDPNYRTSESCDMARGSPDVRPTDEGIAQLLGIDPAHGETVQGQRYAPGQQFRAHQDWFHEDQPYWPKMKASGGQRTWTAMVYLNDVPEGGATWFPSAGVRFKPRRGLLLAWNNMKPDGSPNEMTLHEGMAVLEGTKYIVTKWFREGVWIQ